MADYISDIIKLKDPANIRNAFFASSPYVLRKTFERDPTIQRLVEGHRKVANYIAEEIQRNGENLSEITLACFAYILERINIKTKTRVLQPLFRVATENPGPFFVHFAAHSLRKTLNLPTDPRSIFYAKDKIKETLEAL